MTPPLDRRRLSGEHAEIEVLVRDRLGAQARAVAPLTGGEVGHVFRVETDAGVFAVKLVRLGKDPAFVDEPVDNRVYGARWSNLGPASALLAANGIAAAAVRATGALPERGFAFAILDFVAGDADDFSPAWFAGVGAALGRMHAIKRAYQGWVDMPAPYPERWTAAFARSFRSRLAETAPLLASGLERIVSIRAEGLLVELTEPCDFVFSHTDGFQGVMASSGQAWILRGVIDIEDHQFTDQRFVLAGFELGHAAGGREVLPDFWRAYEAVRSVDPSYETFKPLFQLYYLLVWTRVLSDRPILKGRCIARMEAIVSAP
jgi:fructosamine-3-kinase